MNYGVVVVAGDVTGVTACGVTVVEPDGTAAAGTMTGGVTSVLVVAALETIPVLTHVLAII